MVETLDDLKKIAKGMTEAYLTPLANGNPIPGKIHTAMNELIDKIPTARPSPATSYPYLFGPVVAPTSGVTNNDKMKIVNEVRGFLGNGRCPGSKEIDDGLLKPIEARVRQGLGMASLPSVKSRS